jgi:hypothetical protein
MINHSSKKKARLLLKQTSMHEFKGSHARQKRAKGKHEMSVETEDAEEPDRMQS